MRNGLNGLLACWLCLQPAWLCAQSAQTPRNAAQHADWISQAASVSWEDRLSLLQFQADCWFGALGQGPRADEPSPLLFLPDACVEKRCPPDHRTKQRVACLAPDELREFSAATSSPAQSLLATAAEFGLQAGWNSATERLPSTRNDECSLTDVNVMVRLLEEKQLQWRVGLGVRLLDFQRDVHLGYNFSAALDLFVSELFVISAQGELGRVESAGVRHHRAGVGMTSKRLPHLELFSSYDYLEFGAVRTREPVIGLRFKF